MERAKRADSQNQDLSLYRVEAPMVINKRALIPVYVAAGIMVAAAGTIWKLAGERSQVISRVDQHERELSEIRPAIRLLQEYEARDDERYQSIMRAIAHLEQIIAKR